ncbi:GWxTD domain-containing protein [candidate division KSB1 bacterium]|nr:GWxTD domain-containing protein [candidate division KSB1 bacterium]
MAQPRLQPSMDLVQLQDGERVSYLEINYAVPRRGLSPKHNATNDSLTFALLLDLRIYRDQTLWATKTWKLIETIAANASQDSHNEWLDALRYVLDAPGRYHAVLRLLDLHRPEHADSAEASLATRAFSATSLEVSDVILATDIRKAVSGTASALNKNGYEIHANPQLLFGATQPMLFYYFEAYNLNTALRSDSYKSYWHIENENGEKVAGLDGSYRTKKRLHQSSIEMGMASISALPTGVFTFVYGLADSAKNPLALRRKKLFVYQGAPPTPAVAPSSLNMLAQLQEQELDEEFNRMQHITQPEDKKLYLSLNNAEAKREYLSSLWESHKPEDYAAGISFRQVYLSRARYAETQFPSALRPGWKGDRGRVYILYGPPSHVERETSNPNTKPYEIWRYDDLQGGVIFVFADRTGFKNYELVHSTHRDELQNPDWERSISSGSGSNFGR